MLLLLQSKRSSVFPHLRVSAMLSVANVNAPLTSGVNIADTANANLLMTKAKSLKPSIDRRRLMPASAAEPVMMILVSAHAMGRIISGLHVNFPLVGLGWVQRKTNALARAPATFCQVSVHATRAPVAAVALRERDAKTATTWNVKQTAMAATECVTGSLVNVFVRLSRISRMNRHGLDVTMARLA